jgi:hypothetical protein
MATGYTVGFELAGPDPKQNGHQRNVEESGNVASAELLLVRHKLPSLATCIYKVSKLSFLSLFHIIHACQSFARILA